MKGDQWMVLILVYMKLGAIFLFGFSYIHYGGITGHIEAGDIAVMSFLSPLLLVGFYLDWCLWKQTGKDAAK